MAILTGALSYRGSFKSIRNYRNLHSPHTYAGEKGGANRDLIMRHPSFTRTRENMSEFGGCGAAVKVIRRGLENLLPEKADTYFTGRLMRMAKEVNSRDLEGIRGKRSLLFSLNRHLLMKIVFNVRASSSEMMQGHFRCSHPSSRLAATLSVKDFFIRQPYVPEGATHFRIQHHLSIISDYVYSELNHRYEPRSPLNGKSAFVYSEYISVLSAISTDVVAAFPFQPGVALTDDCTVMQCVGVDFYVRTFGDVYLALKGGCIRVAAVF